MVLRTIFEKEASILNACKDVDTSMFKRPLDSRIFAIKDIRGEESDLGPHNFAIIIADEEGKRIGKYVAVACSPDYLEAFINTSLLPDLNRDESVSSGEVS